MIQSVNKEVERFNFVHSSVGLIMNKLTMKQVNGVLGVFFRVAI